MRRMRNSVLLARAFEVGLPALGRAGVVRLGKWRVLERPPCGVLIAMGGVLDQLLSGLLKALGLAFTGFDQRPVRLIYILDRGRLRSSFGPRSARPRPPRRPSLERLSRRPTLAVPRFPRQLAALPRSPARLARLPRAQGLWSDRGRACLADYPGSGPSNAAIADRTLRSLTARVCGRHFLFSRHLTMIAGERVPAFLRQLTGDRLGLARAAQSKRSRHLTPRTKTADRVAQSICPYCAVGCGQNVFVRDGKVIQIEGDPDSPISRGRLCPKGAAHSLAGGKPAA